MKQIRRMILLPVIAVLVIALLLVFQVITFETELPLETIATMTAVVSAILASGLLGWEVRDSTKSWEHPEPEEPPKSQKIVYPKPIETIEEAMEAVEQAEDYAKRANGRVQINIDIEDAREDDE